jgi:hypothetical protein
MNEIQPTLFENWVLAEYEVEKGMTIAQRAEAFHKANPFVFDALVNLSLSMRGQGHSKWSINGAFEVLRWQWSMHTTGDEFRLNNNFRAFYARKMMSDVPALDGFFETRQAVEE